MRRSSAPSPIVALAVARSCAAVARRARRCAAAPATPCAPAFDNAIQLTAGPGGPRRRARGRQDRRDRAGRRAGVGRARDPDDDVWPLPKGTTARARYGSTTSLPDRYVELYPGPKPAPALPEDGAILTPQPDASVELDESFRIFRGDTDGDLTRRWSTTLGDDARRARATTCGAASPPRRAASTRPATSSASSPPTRSACARSPVAGDKTTTALAGQQRGAARTLVDQRRRRPSRSSPQHTRAQQRALDRAPRTFDVEHRHARPLRRARSASSTGSSTTSRRARPRCARSPTPARQRR